MNKNEQTLFKTCKIGNLDKLKELIEKEDVQLNIRDKWDSTPLYYACLCGHLEIVEYLLANGAKCEANTFDGERCLYGALTDQIRNIIKNYKVVQTKRDQYELFLEKLLELGLNYDIIFEIKGRIFKLHKFILASRSEYFRVKFENKWKFRTWIVGEHEDLIPDAFESIITYIYTGRFNSLKVYFAACLKMAKSFKLNDLIDLFDQKLYKLSNQDLSNENQKEKSGYAKISNKALTTTTLLPQSIQVTNLNLKENDSRNDDPSETPINDTDIFLMGKFGANSKLSHTINIESDYEIDQLTGSIKPSKLSNDLKELAKCCVSYSNLDSNQENDNDLYRIVKYTHDLCITVEDNYKFYAHKAFMEERCEYFRTFLHDPFHEVHQEMISSNSSDQKMRSVAQIQLKEITKDILVEIIYFIYSNQFSADKLEESLLFDLLVVADLYLLPSLKRKCANELIDNYLGKDNLFEFLQTSRIYDLKKMEYACINYLAMNLDDFVDSQKLRETIVEDASKLKMRQETDTIDIVDDLRYKINENTSNLLSNLVLDNKDQQLIANLTIESLLNQKQSSEVASNASKFSKNSAFEKLLVERDRKLRIIDRILRELNLEC